MNTIHNGFNMLTILMASKMGTIPTCPDFKEPLDADDIGYRVRFPLATPRFEEVRAFPPNSNPFHYDTSSMGVPLCSKSEQGGRGLTAMFVDNAERSMYLVDAGSGRRFKITFAEEEWCKTEEEFRVHFFWRYGVTPDIYADWCRLHTPVWRVTWRWDDEQPSNQKVISAKDQDEAKLLFENFATTSLVRDSDYATFKEFMDANPQFEYTIQPLI